jgi:hypothetical protein
MIFVTGVTSVYGSTFAWMNRRPPAQRVVHRHRRLRHEVLIVNIRRDADDAARFPADTDELRHGVGPHHFAIDCIEAGEHPLRNALTDDHDFLSIGAVAVVELAPRDHRHAERFEEAG